MTNERKKMYMPKKSENISSPVGFEPTRGDPNGFLVHRLNHSATTTHTSSACTVLRVEKL